MTALNRLLRLQQDSTINREAQELAAATEVNGNVEVVVTGTDDSGRPIGRTDNGGTITLDNPSGEFIPEGTSAQVTTSSGGIGQVNLGSSGGTTTNFSAPVRRIRNKLRAPVAGNDFGNAGDFWIYERPDDAVNGVVPADLYSWSPNQGAYVLAGGQTGGNGIISTGSVFPSAAYVIDDDTDPWPDSQANISNIVSILAASYSTLLVQLDSPEYLYLKYGENFVGVPDSSPINTIDVIVSNSLLQDREMAAIVAIETVAVTDGVAQSGTVIDAFLMTPNLTQTGTVGANLTRIPNNTVYTEIRDAGRPSFPVVALDGITGSAKIFRRRINPVGMTGADIKKLVVQLRSTGTDPGNPVFISCAISIS